MGPKSLTKLYAAAICIFIIAFSPFISAETWHLKGDQSWEPVTDEPLGEYMLAVSKVKGLITAGQIDSAQQALVGLKENFPDIAGPELDAFMAAEILYAEGKWVKAVRKYDEFLNGWPDSWLYDAALERQYSVAVAFLEGEKRKVLKILKLSAYDEAAKMMHDIADRAGDAPIAKRSLITLARGQDKRGRHLDAYETWAEISTRWPTGQMGKEALLGMAESLHSAYNGPKYDSGSLASARSYYENYKLRYPQLADEYDAKAKIAMVNEQLAYKKFTIGKYYDRTDSPDAAEFYYRHVIEFWPGSTAAKMAKAKLGQHEAGEQPTDAEQGQRKTGRRLFDFGNKVLDEWFGVLKLRKQ